MVGNRGALCSWSSLGVHSAQICVLQFKCNILPEVNFLLVTQSYVSILYLRMPPGFRIILRGQEVQHHNLVDDLMYAQELTYRPQSGADHVSRETDVSVIVKYFLIVGAGWNETGYLLTLH